MTKLQFVTVCVKRTDTHIFIIVKSISIQLVVYEVFFGIGVSKTLQD